MNVVPYQLKRNPQLRFVKCGKWNSMYKPGTPGIVTIRPTEFEFYKRRGYKALGKAPIGVNWTNGLPLHKIASHFGNIGVVCGYGNLRVVDIDNTQLANVLISKLPATFTIQTGSGGLHFYYYSQIKDNNILFYDNIASGELRCYKQHVVAPGSKHPNGNFYVVLRDLPITTIDSEEILRILRRYVEFALQIQQKNNKTDTGGEKNYSDDRSRKEMRRLTWLVAKGYPKDYIFNQMMSAEKWSSSNSNYRERSYERAVQYVNGGGNK